LGEICSNVRTINASKQTSNKFQTKSKKVIRQNGIFIFSIEKLSRKDR